MSAVAVSRWRWASAARTRAVAPTPCRRVLTKSEAMATLAWAEAMAPWSMLAWR